MVSGVASHPDLASGLPPDLAPDLEGWLRRLARSVRAGDFAVSLTDKADDGPIIYCERDGTWWAGRYIGSVLFEGRRLTILPRFGLGTISNWLSSATSAVPVASPGRLREDESFIIQLLALVWVQGFVKAARHGLPTLRRDVAVRGATVRGRLDVRASLPLLGAGGHEAVSIRSERSLAHAASDAIVAAYNVLRRWLPDERWLGPRVSGLLPHLIAAAGFRPRVPTKAALEKVRYTPITEAFGPFAELSRRIACGRGLSADVAVSGETTGVLLDVAELWELYVLNVLRRALPSCAVRHGTRESESSRMLLRSELSGKEMGKLIPDALVYRHGRVCGIADAKYKSLHPTANAPYGPQREDLYQMAAYLARYGAEDRAISGLILYPQDPENTVVPFAEAHNPWRMADGRAVRFMALPHAVEDAAPKLRDIFGEAEAMPDE